MLLHYPNDGTLACCLMVWYVTYCSSIVVYEIQGVLFHDLAFDFSIKLENDAFD
jgi:hypothetical protein